MQLDHALDKGDFGHHHVFDRLTGKWLRQKAYEIAGVTGPQRKANFAVGPEPADTWAVSRAGINDYVGRLFRIGFHPFRRRDPDQPIVDLAR